MIDTKYYAVSIFIEFSLYGFRFLNFSAMDPTNQTHPNWNEHGFVAECQL